MTKEIVAAAIENLPDEFHLDELMKRLIVIEKIEEAEKDVREGRILTHSEVKKFFEEWKK